MEKPDIPGVLDEAVSLGHPLTRDIGRECGTARDFSQLLANVAHHAHRRGDIRMIDVGPEAHIERQVEGRDQRHIDAGHGQNFSGIVDRLPRLQLGNDQDQIIGIGNRLADLPRSKEVMSNPESTAAIASRRVACCFDYLFGLLGVRTCGTMSPMAPISSSSPSSRTSRREN